MRRHLLSALLALCLPAFAHAADAAAPTPVPLPPQVADDGSAEPEPEVRIIQKGEQKIEEYRINGKLYMIKVTPPVGAPYYLVDEDGSGQMQRRQIDPTRRVVIPRWVLYRF
ncbi:uncharacterized protein DUF2782 [Crenobacter luteus]|uniref:DUF2782 domain-containing protein n=1 Tax=Crenobacter luteus TaxID=1452487 RepID=A0A163CYR1_9NEIS|nr:DUF2782 domain-containing protein [Crenobacter luteus]KZE33497.1 hypothetical protein AVW16_08130 [Crenobacter luteus]TCP13071.1 uncharacterized protein DUF2782 [Crenobacter luteus]